MECEYVKRPLVSIVIPAYNAKDFIEKCLFSVINQTYSEIEVIVVDDASSDETVEICTRFPHPIIIIRLEKNVGRGNARNVGNNRAHGEYIVFLDADDMLMPTSVEERLDFLEQHPDIGWVCTDAQEFDEMGDRILFLDKFPWLKLEDDCFVQVLKKCFPLTSTIMIRAKLLQKVGGFNDKLNYGEDLELFMRLFLVSKIGLIRRPLTRRFFHPGQATQNDFDRWNSRIGIFGGFQPSIGKLTCVQKNSLSFYLKHSYFELGKWYLTQLELQRARFCFFNSLGYNERSIKVIIYSLITLLPPSVVRLLRKFNSNSARRFKFIK